LRRKTVPDLMLFLLVMSMLALALKVQPVWANSTIYINADGSINPPTAPISTVDSVTYTFTGNIINESIVVQRNNVIVDGNGYTLQGSGSGTGFSLSNVSNVEIRNTTIANFTYGIWLNFSSDNTLYGNNVTANNGDGIYLDSSSNNTIYHNNFIANSAQAFVDFASLGNVWNDTYPSGGNYWGNYIGIDKKRGPNQDLAGSDGIGDTPYVIDANNTDHCPLIKPYGGPHDLGVTNVATSKTGCWPVPTVGRGYPTKLTTKILNYGIYDETSWLAIYANTSLVQPKMNITLAARSSVNITVLFNTSGLAYGNYTIAAAVDAVPNETDTADNALSGDWIIVTIPGDLNGDFKVDLKDLVLLANYYVLIYPPPPRRWNPNADINGNGVVDLADLVIMANHYGQHYP
jgi:parallel beta-helix repeat protein